MRRNKYIKWVVVALSGILILFMVCMVAAGAGYTVLLADDYTHGVSVGLFHAPFFTYIGASFRYMKKVYLNWQGTYFAMFLQALLSPVNNAGLAQLKIVMIFNALLFFAALFGMVWTLLDLALKKEKAPHIRLPIFAVILFAILDANVFTEVFFWYSGAVSYSIPLSCAFLAVMCFLLYNNNGYLNKLKTVLTVCAAVLSFLASGGSLAVSGVGCYALLLLTIGFYMEDRKVSVRNIAVTVSGIAGALINVAAPGNYVRKAAIDGGSQSLQLMQSIKWTVRIVLKECERFAEETMFGAVLLAMLLAGIYLSGKVHRQLNVYCLLSILALAAGFVAVFPVVLGSSSSEIANRCYFILDVVLLLSMLNLAVCVGICVDKWAGLCDNRSAWVVLFVMLFFAVLYSPEKSSDSALMHVVNSVRGGSYRDYYAECSAVYDYLEHCTEDDVVVEVPEAIDYFECFYLEEDAGGWVNVGVAEYYHKNSVRKKGQ